MTTVGITIYWARKNEPDTVLAEAHFQNDADTLDGGEPYRIVLRRLGSHEVTTDQPVYVIEDTTDADQMQFGVAQQAMSRFLRLVADEVRRLDYPRGGSVLADPRREQAEEIRWRVYGNADPDTVQTADRAAIYAWLCDFDTTTEDPLVPYITEWHIHATDTGYDRKRTLRLVVQNTGGPS